MVSGFAKHTGVCIGAIHLRTDYDAASMVRPSSR